MGLIDDFLKDRKKSGELDLSFADKKDTSYADFDPFDFDDDKSDFGSFLDSLDVGSYSDPFNDDGFNIDFMDALTGKRGNILDYYADDDDPFESLTGLLGAADEDERGFLEAVLGETLGDKKDKPNAFQRILSSVLGTGKGGVNLGQLGLGLGLASLLKDRGAFSPNVKPVGYQGKVPRYTAVREEVTGRDDADRRPGSAGRRYFSDTIFAKKPENEEPMSVEAARAKAKAQAGGFMEGGAVLQDGGYLEGDTDGQADLVPGNIDGVQEALLSHGEFVLPADVVAMLGNGNSNAGAEALDEFMKSVRKEATGTPKQQKNIDADKVLMMLSKRVG